MYELLKSISLNAKIRIVKVLKENESANDAILFEGLAYNVPYGIIVSYEPFDHCIDVAKKVNIIVITVRKKKA